MEITKLEAFYVWNGMNNTPPSEYRTMKEIESAKNIIDLFKNLSDPMSTEVEKVNAELVDVSEDKEDVIKEYNERLAKIEKEQGPKTVELKFSTKEQEVNMHKFFGRWGKLWFPNIHKLIEFKNKLGYNENEKQG